MARGPADVLEVVVFPARSDAALGAGGTAVRPSLPTGEHVLELDHARVREQKSGVVVWNQGGARYYRVAIPLEVRQEAAPRLARVDHRLKRLACRIRGRAPDPRSR